MYDTCQIMHFSVTFYFFCFSEGQLLRPLVLFLLLKSMYGMKSFFTGTIRRGANTSIIWFKVSIIISAIVSGFEWWKTICIFEFISRAWTNDSLWINLKSRTLLYFGCCLGTSMLKVELKWQWSLIELISVLMFKSFWRQSPTVIKA